MQREKAFVITLAVLFMSGLSIGQIFPNQMAAPFAGQDMRLTGKELISYQLGSGEHTLVFTEGFSALVGSNRLASSKAVVWIKTTTSQYRGEVYTDYQATIYLEGDISFDKTGVAAGIHQTRLEGGQAMVVKFDVSGEVYVTAENRQISDPHTMELYRTALGYARSIDTGPKFVVQPGAVVPDYPAEKTPRHIIAAPGVPTQEKPKEPGLIQRIFEPQEPVVPEQIVQKEPQFTYPVVFAPAGQDPLKIDSAPSQEGLNVATIRQRFYVSQRQDDRGRLLELQADNAVIYYSGSEQREETTASDLDDLLARASVRAIYLSGDVIMSEGQRIIRADEIYYDFHNKRAIAINAVMRNFDSDRGIPIYVRAEKLRQLSENKFAADNISITTSEFYLPQLSINAASIVITDTTTIDEQLGKLSKTSYDAEMRNIALKYYDSTIFLWPGMRGNLERPDIPIQSAHLGYDNTYGMSIETRWYLNRILGLKESPGTNSSLMLDYFSKRGMGAGFEIDYKRQDHFGRMLGYIMHDHGKDKLGRYDLRRNLEPPRKLRGRFSWEHRQFLPDNWQLTAGIDYSSDEHFVEQFFRNEYNLRRRETYIHLKQSRDNWALSILGKGRINDFEDTLEELPTVEFHWTGQSLLDDKLTLYSSTQAGHLRQRIGNEHIIAMNEHDFAFISHRSEIDWPIWLKPFKVVPYVAGWYGYDDRSGFARSLVDGTNAGPAGDNQVWIAEAGIRIATQIWNVYPNVESRLWDVHQIRHIIEPHFTAAIFEESDLNVRQHDVMNFGVSQRWQTKRGPDDDKRTVDWMRLDIDATFVKNPEGVTAGSPAPSRFLWNRPAAPLRMFAAPEIFHGDLEPVLHRYETFGPSRDYFGLDYIWRVSDTTALLSDINYDIQSGVVQQANIGFSRLVWPNLSYYVGTRYLRRVQVLGEKGSNAFTFAATYELDPRYTLVFGQQYDFDYGSNIRSDISLIRRYHRVYVGFTFSADHSIDRQSIVLSVWPQGIPEMAMGHKRLSKVGPIEGY
ncbi:MAG: hypothetical protein WDA68_01045 [Phycisphaerae bacterium]